jgi:hypothetical protein
MKYTKTPAGGKAEVRPRSAKYEEAHLLPAESEVYFRSVLFTPHMFVCSNPLF